MDTVTVKRWAMQWRSRLSRRQGIWICGGNRPLPVLHRTRENARQDCRRMRRIMPIETRVVRVTVTVAVDKPAERCKDNQSHGGPKE